MHCTKCGKELPANAAFCPHCGAKQGAEADGPTAAVERMTGAGRGRAAGPEEELWSGTYSPKAMVGPAIGAAVLTAIGALLAALTGPVGGIAWGFGVVLVWGALALVLAYRRMTVRYRLTTFRFFHDTGLLSRAGNRVEVIDIDDVTVHQGLIERMLGVGTILIRSSDATHPELKLPGIEDAKQVADLIDGTRRAERQRRGLHLETI
jgi:membrane protein YdbS with pleckstrin-like domain